MFATMPVVSIQRGLEYTQVVERARTYARREWWMGEHVKPWQQVERLLVW